MKKLIFLFLTFPFLSWGQSNPIQTQSFMDHEADSIKNVIGGRTANNSIRLARMYRNLNSSKASKMKPFTLTTSGITGAATLTDSTLNIPNYAGLPDIITPGTFAFPKVTVNAKGTVTAIVDETPTVTYEDATMDFTNFDSNAAGFHSPSPSGGQTYNCSEKYVPDVSASVQVKCVGCGGELIEMLLEKSTNGGSSWSAAKWMVFNHTGGQYSTFYIRYIDHVAPTSSTVLYRVRTWSANTFQTTQNYDMVIGQSIRHN